jgi:hypothetical protein
VSGKPFSSAESAARIELLRFDRISAADIAAAGDRVFADLPVPRRVLPKELVNEVFYAVLVEMDYSHVGLVHV